MFQALISIINLFCESKDGSTFLILLSGRIKKVDPSLRMYPGAHAICNDNSKLRSDNIGNGTLCGVKKIKLKKDAPRPIWKNWDGYKVYTVSAHYVDHVEFERFPDREDIIGLKSEISAIEEELAASREDTSKSAKLESVLEKNTKQIKEEESSTVFQALTSIINLCYESKDG